MKKILLLGGSAQQVIAINVAKSLGYYTVLCDFLTDNPGQYEADKFYLISTTDREAVLKVAMDENVDGVLAYASDPAAPTAAYVAEQMGLKTNPLNAVETLCNKDEFRKFLSQNGFNTPTSGGYTSVKSAMEDVCKYSMPIIVKPVDSSGSKGVTVVRSTEEFEEAVNFAFSFSRGKRIIVEEFIEKKHEYLIGGDVFIENGKIILWGLLNCHRDCSVNHLVPVGKSYPLELEPADVDNVKKTLQDMVTKLGIQFGAMNVELVVDKNNKVWPIDVGPRNGGNMIPDLLGMIFSVDIVEMTVKAAMGEPVKCNIGEGVPFYATHNFHTAKNGVFSHIEFSSEIEKFIIRKNVYKTKGDIVEYFDNAAKAIGIVFLKFNTEDEMKYFMKNINEHIQIVLQ